MAGQLGLSTTRATDLTKTSVPYAKDEIAESRRTITGTTTTIRDKLRTCSNRPSSPSGAFPFVKASALSVSAGTIRPCPSGMRRSPHVADQPCLIGLLRSPSGLGPTGFRACGPQRP